MVEFRILGGLQCLAGSEQVSIGGARQRAVLALLLLETPASVSVQRLIDELWTERPPSTASHAVEVYVSALRKALHRWQDEVVLRHSASGYVLDVDRERVDSRRFAGLVDEAEHAMAESPGRARALLEQALELWRGPPLVDLSQFEFVRRESDRLREIHGKAVESLAEARLECGEPGQTLSALTGLVAANPLREHPRRLLMLALYRAGRQAEALAVYRDACDALADVGLQPGPELRDLEALILRHDSSLKVVPSPLALDGRLKRKVVTALCCDLIGRPIPGDEMDPEARLSIVDRRFEQMRLIVQRHGGAVVSSIGDSGTVVFGTPRIREDDALRAVRAAADLAGCLSQADEWTPRRLRPRIGINTGLALIGERDNVVLGDAIDLAVRLEHAAAPGQILLGPETVALVRHAVRIEPLGSRSARGEPELEWAGRLIWTDSSHRVYEDPQDLLAHLDEVGVRRPL